MVNAEIVAKAKEWLQPEYDEETRNAVRKLIETDERELVEAFYRSLEFGTGGLRGIMGVGTNRMNVYTVGMATQGLCNYLVSQFQGIPEIRVAIAHDSRNNSRLFAQITANIFSANNVKVYLFEDLRPTPELSFAIRTLKCHCGVVVTASHNPKEYNGYKVYWQDGGQVVPPHDVNIIEHVQKISQIAEVKFTAKPELIQAIGKQIDEVYVNTLSSLSLSPSNNLKHKDIKIVYTPIHGSGVELVPMALRKFGFANITTIAEQCVSDGNFPTVVSPNPEEPAAMRLALEKGKEIDADIIMATDPDADRVGIGVKNNEGNFILLNGNQAAAILVYYMLINWKRCGKLTGNEFIVKTIVTTDLLADMAKKFGVDCHEVLTGFKYIAEIIREKEGKHTFIAGGEESYGYLVGDYARDKDAVVSCCMFAEIAAWAKEQGKSVFDVLMGIYAEFGLYKEHLVSLTKKGKDGVEQIVAMMAHFRSQPPKTLGGVPVSRIIDYQLQQSTDVATGRVVAVPLPKSDVLQFIATDGTKVSVRPSGTEPKIKFYFGVRGKLASPDGMKVALDELDARIAKIVDELGIKN